MVPGDGGIVFPEAPGSFLASSQAGVVFWEAEERLSGSLLQFLYPCSFHAVLCSSPSQGSHGSSSCLLALLQTSSSPFAAAQMLLGSLDSLFSPSILEIALFFPPAVSLTAAFSLTVVIFVCVHKNSRKHLCRCH